MNRERIPVSDKPTWLGDIGSRGGVIVFNSGSVDVLVDDIADMLDDGIAIAPGASATIPNGTETGTKLYAKAPAGDGAEVTLVSL
jgi:hypothetical protein